MSVSRLQVTYINSDHTMEKELDKSILEFFNKLDFICINRDYNFLDFKRTLDFEKHTKDVGKKYTTQYHLKPMYVGEGIDESSSN